MSVIDDFKGALSVELHKFCENYCSLKCECEEYFESGTFLDKETADYRFEECSVLLLMG